MYKAQVASFRSVQKKLDVTLQVINANRHFRFEFKGRDVQEKFNMLVKDFRKENSSNRRRLRKDGEMNTKYELLSGILEAVQSMRETNEHEREEVTNADSRKLKAGRRILAAYWCTPGAGSSDDTGEDCKDAKRSMETMSCAPKRHFKMRKAMTGDGGHPEFDASMQDAEIAKFALQYL